MLRSRFTIPVGRVLNDSSGTVAVLFAITLVVLLMAMGAGTDYWRALNFKAALQGAADSAALAGASAYVNASSTASATAVATKYMNAMAPGLPSNIGVSYNVTTSQTSGAQGDGYTVTVTASGKVQTTVASLIMQTIPVSISATAINPLVTITFDLGEFYSSAWDANTVYYYMVPADGSLPTPAELTLVYSNTKSSNPNPAPVQVSATQKIGFALQNVTGGNQSYGNNQYGGTPGSVQWFYSQLNPPSQIAYPSWTQNCSLQVMPVNSDGSWPTPQIACFTSTPPLATANCSQLNGQTMLYAWNDMGGATDDHDYNDAEYTFSCSDGGSGSGTIVKLVK